MVKASLCRVLMVLAAPAIAAAVVALDTASATTADRAVITPVADRSRFTVIDDSGARLTLPTVARRIVSLSPGATEMLFGAGAGDRIVATVEYSDQPPAATRIARIGDVTAIDVERLLSLHPDVAIIWPAGGNSAQIEKLSKLGVPLYRQQVDQLGDLPASLRRLGILAGTTAAADRSARDVEGRLAFLRRQYVQVKPFRVLIQVWDRPIYTVGGRHLMSDALRLCGATNVFGDLLQPGPAVDAEAVVARDPDVIVAAAPPGSAQRWLADWRRFPAMRAVRDGRLIAFEDTRFSRLGPSMLAATEALCKLLTSSR